MRAFQQVQFYDPSTDAQSVRISGFSGRGEFWCKRIIPTSGAKRRAMLRDALDLIEQAIERDLLPGEVVTDD